MPFAGTDLLTQAPVVVFKCAAETGWPVVFVTENVEDVFGLTAKAILNRRALFIDMVHPDDREAFLEETRLHEAKSEERFSCADRRLLGIDGRVFWVQPEVRIVRDGAGRPLVHLVYLHDITDRRKIEDTLRASEAYHRRITDSAPDAIVTADAEARIVSWNDGARRLFGYREDEALGQPLAMLVPKRYRSSFAEAMVRQASGEASAMVPHPHEVAALHKEGHEVPAEISVSRWHTGDETYFTGIVRDISRRKDAEMALRRNEAHFRTIFDRSLVGMLTVDAVGCITSANDAVCTMLRYPERELVGKPIRDIVAPPDVDEAEDLRKRLWRGELTDLRKETRYQRRTGGDIWCLDTVTVVRDANNKPGYFLYEVLDITTRRGAEERTQRNLTNQNALGAILRNALQPLPIERILNLALEEILSVPWLKLQERGCIFLYDEDAGVLKMATSRNFSPWTRDTCAQVPLGHCLCGRAAAQGETLHCQGIDHKHEIQYKGIQPHGHYCVPIKGGGKMLGILNTYTSPGRQRSAEEEAFLVMVADTLAGIIERKHMEERLKLSGAVFDAAGEAILVTDTDHKIIAANPAFERITGLQSDEVAEWTPERLASKRHRPEFFEAVWHQLAESGKWEGELWMQRPDGSEYPARLGITAIRDHDRVVNYCGVFNDITARKEAELALTEKTSELQQSNSELEQFAYVISHDLQEPLRMVASYAKLLGSKYSEHLGPEADEFLGYILDGAEGMQAMIRDLLELSRVGTRGESFTKTDLTEVMDRLQTTLAPAIEESGATIEFDGLPVINADSTQILRLFQNLLGNAIKYRAPKRRPKIQVSARREENAWEIAISDNGIGIDSEHLERVFLIFQRLHPRGEHPGTGMGLAICRKIVERHGGRIWVESTPKKGSTFRFILPLWE